MPGCCGFFRRGNHLVEDYISRIGEALERAGVMRRAAFINLASFLFGTTVLTTTGAVSSLLGVSLIKDSNLEYLGIISAEDPVASGVDTLKIVAAGSAIVGAIFMLLAINLLPRRLRLTWQITDVLVPIEGPEPTVMEFNKEVNQLALYLFIFLNGFGFELGSKIFSDVDYEGAKNVYRVGVIPLAIIAAVVCIISNLEIVPPDLVAVLLNRDATRQNVRNQDQRVEIVVGPEDEAAAAPRDAPDLRRR